MTFGSSRFGFLVMVYDRIGDGDKFLNENFCLGRPHFFATSHLKNEDKVLFCLVNANATM